MPHVLDSETRKQLREYVDRVGDVRAAQVLGVGRLTVARALAGLHLRLGSIEIIRNRLRLLTIT